MNKLVLSTGMGFGLPLEEQIATMAEVGWDGFFPGLGAEDDFDAVRRIADKNGMFLQSVHAPFVGVDAMWREGKPGEDYTNDLCECLRKAESIGVDIVVMHAFIGFGQPVPNYIGLKNFSKIFEAADKLGVNVALENTEGEPYLAKILETFGDIPYVKFCIDTGHEMCYNGSEDLIGRYSKNLICTHLNDNMAQTGTEVTWLDDSHMLPFDGAADWNGIAERLRSAGYKGDLTFELTSKNKPERHTHDIYSHLNFKAFSSLALERAQKFKNIYLG